MEGVWQTHFSEIEGVLLFDLINHHDNRGCFTEDYRNMWAGLMPQSNISRSRANVIRGMHFHLKQYDYWCIVSGQATVALYDLRDGSPTENTFLSLYYDARTNLGPGLLIPPGVAHGFLAMTDAILHYSVSRYHDGQDEFGFLWSEVEWPIKKPILSERDSQAPTLEEVSRPVFGLGP